MNITGERLVLGAFPHHVEEEHVQRYMYAASFVKDKTLLDIACGTGYGTKMLLKDGGAAYVLGLDSSRDAISYASGIPVLFEKSVNLTSVTYRKVG